MIVRIVLSTPYEQRWAYRLWYTAYIAHVYIIGTVCYAACTYLFELLEVLHSTLTSHTITPFPLTTGTISSSRPPSHLLAVELESLAGVMGGAA